MSAQPLKGEVALVTGASRGIGAAIADELAAQGATVIGTATTDNGAQAIGERLAAQGGHGRTLNVTDGAAVEALIDEIAKQFGGVSILVNNAGITRDNLLMRMKEEDWQAILDTNLSSVFRTSKAVMRGMMKARKGRIINIASVIGVTGNAGQANYAAAKAGIIAFSKSLAKEIGSRGITVNVVAPGFIATDMTASLPEDAKAALVGQIALGRLGEPVVRSDERDGLVRAGPPRHPERRRRSARHRAIDPRRARAPVVPAGAVDRLRAGARIARRRAHRRMRPGQGAHGTREAHRQEHRRACPRHARRHGIRAYRMEPGMSEQTMKGAALSGEVALVTGASRGIGAAIADELASLGATVIGTATTDSGAQAIGERLAAHGGHGRMLNVTDGASIDALVDEIAKQFGGVSILVNNAGITRDNLLMRMKDDDWQAILDTNLSSVYRTSKAVMRGMMKARKGRIVNIASVIGVTGNAGQSNYAAAKAGIIAFSKSLAKEIGSRGITVNVVAPGFIATDMTRDLPEDAKQALVGQIALGRLGEPADIARAVAFLAGPAAAYITGETLHVNGGMYMP